MSAKEILPDSQFAAQRIIESAGVTYAGAQETTRGILYLFCDPLTGTSLAIRESELNLERLQAHIAESRALFGVRQW